MSYDDGDIPQRKNTCIHGMSEATCGYCGPKTSNELPGSRIAPGAQSGIPEPVCVGCKKTMDFGNFYRDHRNCIGLKDHPVLRRREEVRLARITVAKNRDLVVPDDLWRVCSNVMLDRFSSVSITDQRSFIFYLGTSAWESWGSEILGAL